MHILYYPCDTHTHTHTHTHMHTHTRIHMHTHTHTHTQARTGVGKNTVDVLKLLQSYTNETSFTVWDSITDTLSFINLLLGSTDFLPAFQSYALTLLGPAMSRLGWTPRDTDCECALLCPSPYHSLPQSLPFSAPSALIS